MKENKRVWGKWIYWFTFAVAVIAVYKTLDSFNEILDWIRNLFSILMPFIMGVLVAYLFYIPCKRVENFYRKRKNKLISKKARGLSILTVYLIVIIMCVLIFKFVIPNITQSIMDLINNLPSYYNNALEELDKQPEDSILSKINAKEIINNIQSIDMSKFLDMESIGEYAKGVINFATMIFDIFVTFIISIYILLERTEILKFAKRLCKAIFKEKSYKNIGVNFARANRVFFKFLSGQMIDAIVVAVLTSIAMLILGVKYAVLLGVLIGISNLIPYLGAIIGVLISIIITIFTGGIPQAIWLAIVVIIIQQVDANIINPKIVGDSLEISPILVIFSVTLIGAYFGILGMFLAVPIVTVIKLIIEEYISYKIGQKDKVKKKVIE